MWFLLLLAFWLVLSPTPVLGEDCSSVTRGFPTLKELIRNGSLLERYLTHDGELRSVPGVKGNCSGNPQISRVTFIALPGAGMESTFLAVDDENGDNIVEFAISGANLEFGEFGHVLILQSVGVRFREDYTLSVRHHPGGNSLRLLHQVGDVARNICWSIGSGPQTCQPEYDYPLLAIETDPPGCADGLVTTSELRRFWENRDSPVLYSSPERQIPLNCPTALISRILVGAYPSMTGDGATPQIVVDNDNTCSVSAEPVSEEVNVYECVLNPPVSVDGDDSLTVSQRNAASQIGFIHDGQTDIPLITVDIVGGDCSSSQFLNEADLRGITALYIPDIIERESIVFFYHNFTVTQPATFHQWIFIAKEGEGEEYPVLAILPPGGVAVPTELIGCVESLHPNVYECTFTPLQVQTGDSVVIILPARNTARLLLSFILNGQSPGDPLGNEDASGVPLMTLGLVPHQSCSKSSVPSSSGLMKTQPHPSSNIVFPSSSLLPTMAHLSSTTSHYTSPLMSTNNPSSNSTTIPGSPSGQIAGYIIIGLVSCLCLMMLTVSILLVLVLLWRKTKPQRHTVYSINAGNRQRGESIVTTTTNPAYSSGQGHISLSTNVAYTNAAAITPGETDMNTDGHMDYISPESSTAYDPDYAAIPTANDPASYPIYESLEGNADSDLVSESSQN